MLGKHDVDENGKPAGHPSQERALLLDRLGLLLEESFLLVHELGRLRYEIRRPIGRMQARLLAHISAVKAHVGALASWNLEERQLWLTVARDDARSGKTQ